MAIQIFLYGIFGFGHSALCFEMWISKWQSDPTTYYTRAGLLMQSGYLSLTGFPVWHQKKKLTLKSEKAPKNISMLKSARWGLLICYQLVGSRSLKLIKLIYLSVILHHCFFFSHHGNQWRDSDNAAGMAVAPDTEIQIQRFLYHSPQQWFVMSRLVHVYI